MSNLGRYQDIVVEAAQAGGVDNLIKSIEANAVAKAAPRKFLAGAGVATAVFAIGSMGWKRFSESRRTSEQQASEAKAKLHALVEEPTDEDSGGNEHGLGSDEHDEGDGGL